MAKTPDTNDFDFIAWLDTGVVATRKVTLYIDAAAAAEYMRVVAELDSVEAGEDDDSMTGGKAAHLRERKAELEAMLKDAQMVVTVRALSKEEVDAANEAIPSPKSPMPPKENAAPEVQARFMEKIEVFLKAKQQAEEARKLALLGVAVQQIETAAGTRDHITAEELASFRKRPHGQQWLDLLWAATNEATDEKANPELPQ
jgi:hypothetical protein